MPAMLAWWSLCEAGLYGNTSALHCEKVCETLSVVFILILLIEGMPYFMEKNILQIVIAQCTVRPDAPERKRPFYLVPTSSES